MSGGDAIAALIAALETVGVPYMVVGSLSSNVYGIARSTVDADFVVELQAGDLGRLMQQLGPCYSLDPQTKFETTTGTIRHVIRVAESEFALELFRLSDDVHDRERFHRRVRMELSDLERVVYLPTVEDVVVTKLRWGRGKDRDDVRDVISVQGGMLDWQYVEHWCDLHGTREVLEEIRSSIPGIDPEP